MDNEKKYFEETSELDITKIQLDELIVALGSSLFAGCDLPEIDTLLLPMYVCCVCGCCVFVSVLFPFFYPPQPGPWIPDEASALLPPGTPRWPGPWPGMEPAGLCAGLT